MAGMQEEPGINPSVVMFWTISMVVILLGAWLISIWVVRARPNGPLAQPVTPPGVAPTFGFLEQKQFGQPNYGRALEHSERKILTSFGWNGAAHRSAHVPIWRAEQMLLSRPRGADAGR